MCKLSLNFSLLDSRRQFTLKVFLNNKIHEQLKVMCMSKLTVNYSKFFSKDDLKTLSMLRRGKRGKQGESYPSDALDEIES